MFFLSGRQPDTIHRWSMRVRAATAYAALLTASAAFAAPPIPLTLAEAEDLALQDEPGLVELRASASSFVERSVSAGQLPDPSMRIGLANYPISDGDFSTEGMTQAQLG